MLKVLARGELKPGALEAMAPLFKELIEKTRKEKGCEEYGFFIDLADETKGCFVETWATEEDLAAHAKSEHFTTIFPKLRELGFTMGEVTRMRAFV